MNRLSRVALLLSVALCMLMPVGPPYALADPIGGLIVIPGLGSDLTPIRVHTSAGCPANSNAYEAKMKGRGFPPAGQVVTANTKAGLSHSVGFDAYFLLIMRDFATRNHTTLGGRYDITVYCIDAFTLNDYGEFAGSLEFSSPIHYEALGAAQPIGPPPPSLEQATDGSALPPQSAALPSPATSQVVPPPSETAPGAGSPTPITQSQPGSDAGSPSVVGHVTSERNDATSQGARWLVVVRLMLVIGVGVAVVNRIRKRHTR